MRGKWETSDTWNLLSNIGFTALAGVGLGAAKGAKMAGKAGRVARTARNTRNLGKVGKAVDKVTTAGKSAIRSGKVITSGAREASRFNRAKRMADIALRRSAGTSPEMAKSAKRIRDLAKTSKTAKAFNTAVQSSTYAQDMANVANMATKVT